MTLSSYGKSTWSLCIAIGVVIAIILAALQWWWAISIPVIGTFCALAFFRDPARTIPTDPNSLVSPCDGSVSSIHDVPAFEPFDGEDAVCVRVFMSLLSVHVNRAPCDGVVDQIIDQPGKYLSALNPISAEENTWKRFVLRDAASGKPVAAVRQIAGRIARTIVCGSKEGDTLKRGERFGLIKFGSTSELYVPKRFQPEVVVSMGQKVEGGLTVLVKIGQPTTDSTGATNSGNSTDSTKPVEPASAV